MMSKIIKLSAVTALLGTCVAAYAATDCCGDLACCMQMLACCFQ
ncbi:MAG: hypothetical protein V4739_02520 [Pseudomonadota bacterium]